MSQSLFLTIHIASVLGSAQGSQWSLALEGFFASGNFKANDPLFPQGLTPPLESGGRQYPTCCLAPGIKNQSNKRTTAIPTTYEGCLKHVHPLNPTPATR